MSGQGHRPTAWQVKRLLTEERVPAGSAIARFVGVAVYEAADGPVLRDLFADEHENGVWLEDPRLLRDLAMKKLTAIADELSTRWKWAEAMVEVDWSATARYGRIRPVPGEPTDEETAEIERLRSRFDELTNLDDGEWTEKLVEESDAIEARLDEIDARIEARARFRREDFATAGCIATIGRDGALQVIQGLVKPEDLPQRTATPANGYDADPDGGGQTAPSTRVDGPSVTAPVPSPPDPRAKARQEAGVGIGLGDDLRAIRTALVKTHLAGDFEAAFDLVVFQMARSVFARTYTTWHHALDIAFRETADRPTTRRNDDGFDAWSPGEAMLADWSHLPFEWMEADDDAACFAALRVLPRADKEKLFAAAVARTVKGQLAFEHDARPELEATVARLGIDFAKHVRPTAAMLWSRIKKSRILDIARETFGPAWASARSKYKKADLARAMEDGFAAGERPVGIGKAEHSAALAWTLPGFAAFDTGGADGDAPEAQAAEPPADDAHASGGAKADPVPGDTDTAEGPADGNGRGAAVHEEPEAGAQAVNDDETSEQVPAEPTVAEAIDAMNRVPTADGGAQGDRADRRAPRRHRHG